MTTGGASGDAAIALRGGGSGAVARSEEGDVLIAGAGPAGSSLALRLARAGIRVRLLDASRFPRSKPCGDCLSPGATPLLRELGVAGGLRAGGAGRIRGWRIRTPGGAWFEGRFGADGSAPARGLSLPRRDLDRALLEAALGAGVEFHGRTRVFGLLRENGRVVGVRARGPGGSAREMRTRLVVGADGLRSTVARRLGGVRRGRRRRLALVGRFRGVAGGGEMGEMRLSADGCLGAAPVGGGRWNVTVVVPARCAASISGDREGFFEEVLGVYGVGSRFAGARLSEELEITGPFEVAPRRRTAPGALLVGDAAGYFDPMTGQGVYRALVGARLAARAARASLGARSEAGREAALRRYEVSLEECLGAARRVQRWIDRAVSRPALIEPLGRAFAARPGIASLLMDVTGDRVPPESAFRPLLLGSALREKR